MRNKRMHEKDIIKELLGYYVICLGIRDWRLDIGDYFLCY